MKLRNLSKLSKKWVQAFSLAETVVGMGIVGLVSSGLFASFSLGYTTVRLSRENARATQVMMEKLEVFRLYSWDQVTNASFVPRNFTSPFVVNSDNPGFYYTGTVSVANIAIGNSYDADMRQVTINVKWNSVGGERHRQVETYVSRYGIQNYTY